MKLAFVGADGSSLDIIILADFLQLQKVKIESKNIDIINLNLGRDFLKEDKEYDYVILNYIFDPGDKPNAAYLAFQVGDEFNTSKLQSPKAWNKRLKSTKAKKIFIFSGGDKGSEVDGRYIGPIEGYNQKLISNTCGEIWVYDRKTL